MKSKKKIKELIIYLKKINNERIEVNNELNNELDNLIKQGKKLSEYELWINKKCNIMIQPQYAIKKVVKKLSEEGFSDDIVFVIVREEPEEVKIENENN